MMFSLILIFKNIIILKFGFLDNPMISVPPYAVGTSLYEIILMRWCQLGNHIFFSIFNSTMCFRPTCLYINGRTTAFNVGRLPSNSNTWS